MFFLNDIQTEPLRVLAMFHRRGAADRSLRPRWCTALQPPTCPRRPREATANHHGVTGNWDVVLQIKA